uniref:Ufd2P_core domain-containing protein n=1 Tax=Angiostrongylus cantonensis TaxID=6313 RepID=A0A0K0DEZ7_ANGCA
MEYLVEAEALIHNEDRKLFSSCLADDDDDDNDNDDDDDGDDERDGDGDDERDSDGDDGGMDMRSATRSSNVITNRKNSFNYFRVNDFGYIVDFCAKHCRAFQFSMMTSTLRRQRSDLDANEMDDVANDERITRISGSMIAFTGNNHTLFFTLKTHLTQFKHHDSEWLLNESSSLLLALYEFVENA